MVDNQPQAKAFVVIFAPRLTFSQDLRVAHKGFIICDSPKTGSQRPRQCPEALSFLPPVVHWRLRSLVLTRLRGRRCEKKMKPGKRPLFGNVHTSILWRGRFCPRFLTSFSHGSDRRSVCPKLILKEFLFGVSSILLHPSNNNYLKRRMETPINKNLKSASDKL